MFLCKNIFKSCLFFHQKIQCDDCTTEKNTQTNLKIDSFVYFSKEQFSKQNFFSERNAKNVELSL
jgi:hypothetical protein